MIKVGFPVDASAICSTNRNSKHLWCRYQRSGDTGVPVLLVHGFGANADHWRKNTPVIGEWGKAFAIDLLGYGYSDKPDPTTQEKNTIYNFENWAGMKTSQTNSLDRTTILC
jgi:pimeloyl-ACP methyl ester carboxylesterase